MSLVRPGAVHSTSPAALTRQRSTSEASRVNVGWVWRVSGICCCNAATFCARDTSELSSSWNNSIRIVRYAASDTAATAKPAVIAASSETRARRVMPAHGVDLLGVDVVGAHAGSSRSE